MTSPVRHDQLRLVPNHAFEGIDRALLARLRLIPDDVISADGDSFVTVRCHDESGCDLVLKYVRRDVPDVRRRLTNETLLVENLAPAPPLRLLSPRRSGPGYLLTDYDPGRLLRPETIHPDDVIRSVAASLVQFQSLEVNPRALGLVDREHVATYYVKVLLKHILHLWPIHLTIAEARGSLALVIAALPAILSRRVICHGDFLPTNLLYHADRSTLTLTDLEGFMTRNHPLFDVMALFTMNDLDIRSWEWQPRFLHDYLARLTPVLGLDPHSVEFERAYRGILIFFLVYRLNEARILRRNGLYFDGRRQIEYVLHKAAALLSGREDARRDDEMVAAMAVRKQNLLLALSREGFREHLDAMRAAFSAPARAASRVG